MRAALLGVGSAREELALRLRCVPDALVRLQRSRGSTLGREDLRDLAQEVQLTLWARLADYTGAAPIEAWAAGFCVNAHRNAVRKLSRRSWLQQRIPPENPEPGLDPLPLLERAELLEELESLTREEALAVRMKCYAGLTFAEIGARLGLSPSSVKTSYYRAIRRLAQALGREPRPP